MSEPAPGMAGTVARIANESGKRWCGWCGNTGIVTLRGATRVGPYSYTRGTTACRWCEIGAAKYRSLRERQVDVVTDYGEEDVEPEGLRHRTPAANKRERYAELEAKMRSVGVEERKAEARAEEQGGTQGFRDA